MKTPTKIKLILTICSAILLCVVALMPDISKAGADENFKMEISTEKNEYIEGEYVILMVKVKNNGTQTDSIEFLNDDYLSKSILLKNQAGRSSSYRGADVFYVGVHFASIPANGEIVFPIKLNYLWGFRSFDSYDETSKAFASRYFPEGKYTVEVNFKYDKGRKKISSNKIDFEVKASDASETEAFEKFKELYKFPYGGFYSETQNQQTILKWIEFMDTHRNSVYYDNAFYESVYKRKFNDFMYDSTMLDDCQHIINDKPNTLTARTAINTAFEIIEKISGKDAALLYLEKIKSDYPGTESSKWAERLLEGKEF